MTYKKLEIKHQFECEKCGIIMDGLIEDAPKSCPGCEYIEQGKMYQEMNKQRRDNVANFKKKNNFAPAQCCANCKKVKEIHGWDGDDDSYYCLGVDLTGFEEQPEFIVDPTDYCVAFEL